MEKLKEILLSHKAQAFYYQTINGAIVLAIAYFSEMDIEKYPFVLFAIPLLNTITKTINLKIQGMNKERKEDMIGLGL